MAHQDRRSQGSVELADVFRRHGERYAKTHTLTPEQYKVMHAIMNCRTSILGGHADVCDHCDQLHIAYNSCRNRHCPKCAAFKTLQWLDNRRKELLPVPYFHVVFTLPHELNPWIRYNRKLMHSLLFQAAWETLNTLGQDPDRLDGRMGMLAILHTWSQNLSLHPHLHCIVPGGALTKSGMWASSKKGFLFPVKVMGKLFRGIYVSKFRALYQAKKLKIPDQQNVDQLLNTLMKKNWVVYAKKPFAGPQKLLDYLGKYTHKIAISNCRILACDENSVTFKWRDYSDQNKIKVMTLSADEFMRRFLQHVVPSGFMRIRSFGFLANAAKAKRLPLIRKALDVTESTEDKKDAQTIMLVFTGVDITLCPACQQGHLHRVASLPSKFGRTLFDTS